MILHKNLSLEAMYQMFVLDELICLCGDDTYMIGQRMSPWQLACLSKPMPAEVEFLSQTALLQIVKDLINKLQN